MKTIAFAAATAAFGLFSLPASATVWKPPAAPVATVAGQQAQPVELVGHNRNRHRGPAARHAPPHRWHGPAPRAHAPQHRGPRVGHGARNARIINHGHGYRLAPPPRGQHYRIVDNTVVRVDDRTLQIVAVMGLMSLFLR